MMCSFLDAVKPILEGVQGSTCQERVRDFAARVMPANEDAIKALVQTLESHRFKEPYNKKHHAERALSAEEVAVFESMYAEDAEMVGEVEEGELEEDHSSRPSKRSRPDAADGTLSDDGASSDEGISGDSPVQ